MLGSDKDKPERSAYDGFNGNWLGGQNSIRLPISIKDVGRRKSIGNLKNGGGGGPPSGCSTIMRKLRRPGCLRTLICVMAICLLTYTIMLRGMRKRYHGVIRIRTDDTSVAEQPQQQQPTAVINNHQPMPDSEQAIVVGSHPRLPAAKLPDPVSGASSPAVPMADWDPSRRPSRPAGQQASPAGDKDPEESIAWYKEQYDAMKRNMQEEIENAVVADRERHKDEHKQLVEAELSSRLANARGELEKEFEKKLADELARANSDKSDNTLTAELDRIFMVANDSQASGKIFNPDLATRMQNTRGVKLTGFRMCRILEGAEFNAWVHIGKRMVTFADAIPEAEKLFFSL